MAVKGLNLFCERFSEFKETFILIGGAACDLWFSDHELDFRATKDIDIVLVLEHMNSHFIGRFREFVKEGQYEVKNRNKDGPPVLYRFAKPGKDEFPFMLELFCRQMPELDLAPAQEIIPVRIKHAQSLSAILLHESYYNFLLDHCRESRGIMVANSTALIPFKAKAWLDLTSGKQDGMKVDLADIKKHRNDIFRLAATLPEEPGATLPDELIADMQTFLQHHPPDSDVWDPIQQAIRATLRGPIPPEKLLSAIKIHYQLPTISSH